MAGDIGHAAEMPVKSIIVTGVTGVPFSTVYVLGDMRACARIRPKREYPSHPSLCLRPQALSSLLLLPCCFDAQAVEALTGVGCLFCKPWPILQLLTEGF